MNRKERRRLRKMRSETARENYLKNKRDWLYRYGPVAVMDQPTEAHVKALLMQWVAVNNLVAQINQECKFRPKKPTHMQLMKMLLGNEAVDMLEPPGPLRDAWKEIMAQIVTDY